MSSTIFRRTWQTFPFLLMNEVTQCTPYPATSPDHLIPPFVWWLCADTGLEMTSSSPHCSNSYIPCKCQGPRLLGRDVAKLTPCKAPTHQMMLSTIICT